MRHLLWVLAAALLGAFACTSSPSLYGEEEVLVLEVAPDVVPCVGEMYDQCIQVRSPGEESWRIFYDPIQGFEREDGVGYILEVSRREVRDPPMDGSAYVYRLIRIMERMYPEGSPGSGG